MAENKITKEAVWDVMTYAESMAKGLIAKGAYNPWLINSEMKNITSSPVAPTEAELELALKNAINSEKSLASYGDYFEQRSFLYKKVIQYYGNLPSFNLEFQSTPKKKIGSDIEYDSDKYKRDEKELQKFLKFFNYKQEFKKVVKQMLRHDADYTVLRTDNINKQMTLQELPNEFCKIDGRWSKGLVYSFDLNWFTRVTSVDWQMYPKILTDQYLDILSNKTNQYNPAMTVSGRNSTYVYWTQLKPEDGFWAFKFTPEMIAQIPFFSPLYQDFALKDTLRRLQTNKYIIDASQILIGLIGTHNDSKGNASDNLKLTPELAGTFSGLIRNALGELGDGVKFASAPFENVLDIKGSTSANNIYDKYNQNVSKELGGVSQVLYPYDKLNAIESEYSMSVDAMLITDLYTQFENFMEFFINKETKHYDFDIRFVGVNTPKDKERRANIFKEKAALGIVDVQEMASSSDLNYFELKERLRFSKESGIRDFLVPLQTSHTLKGGGENGRPQKDTGDMTDSGIDSRAKGSNVDKGGKV